MERVAGVEPAPAVWKTAVQPPGLRPQGLPESSGRWSAQTTTWPGPGQSSPVTVDNKSRTPARTVGPAGGVEHPDAAPPEPHRQPRPFDGSRIRPLARGPFCDSRRWSPINNLYGATPVGCRTVLCPARESNSHALPDTGT